MKTQFVIVVADVHCKPTGATKPVYRCYVEDELFAERTWIWDNVYLEEAFQIEAPPGQYKIGYELTDPTAAEIKIKNLRVTTGSAIVHKHGILEVIDENS